MSSRWNSNSYKSRRGPVVERRHDPVNMRDVYKINGKGYYTTLDAEPHVGGFVESLSPSGLILVVQEVKVERSMLGSVSTTVYARPLTSTSIDIYEYLEGDYKVLVAIVQDPCPWCGSELTSSHVYGSGVDGIGMRLEQFKKDCEKCGSIGMSEPGSPNEVFWYNSEEQRFDPKNKSILDSPNFIDEEPAGWEVIVPWETPDE
jgi:hypothetical protein